MDGDLSETSAADLCRDLAARGATGTLELDGPDGPGRVGFADGFLVTASSPTPRARLGDRLVGAGLLDDDALTRTLEAQSSALEHTRLGALLVDEGLVSQDAVRLFVQEQILDALFDILRWRYGTHRFTESERAEVPEVPLTLGVEDALVEVSRRQREWDELSRVIPDLEAVPTFASSTSTTNAALEPDEFAVLASVDGERSIRELAADLGYGEFEAARIVYALCLLGVVDVRVPEDEVGAALEDALAAGAEDPALGGRSGEPWPTATEEDAGAPSPPGAEEPARTPAEAASAEPSHVAGAGDDDRDGDAPDEGTVIEADLPDSDLGFVLTPPEPTSRRPGESSTADDDAGPREPDHEPPDTGSGSPGDRGAGVDWSPGGRAEVSEFLRELSRLAIEDDADTPPFSTRRRRRDRAGERSRQDETDDAERSGGTSRSEDAGRSGGTGRSEDAGRSGSTGRSEDAGRSGGTGRSGDAGRSGGTGRSGGEGRRRRRGLFGRG